MAPTERFTTMDDELRERLLNTARAEFSGKGFEGASLNRIIQNASISKGSFYYYFEDKVDLYITVVGEAMTEFMASHGGAPEIGDDFWGGMRVWIRALVEHSLAEPDVAKLLGGVRAVSAQLESSERFQEMYAESMRILSEVIAIGRRMGEVRDDLPDEVLTMTMKSVGMVFDLWHIENFEEAKRLGLEVLTDRYVDIFFRIAAPQERLMKGLASSRGTRKRNSRGKR